MKIAIIHEWLTTYSGSERVVEQMLKCFPTADIFSLIDFIPEKERDFLLNKKVTTSFIQKLPFAKSKYHNYLPLMPFAIEQFDLSEYDLVISSSHAVAKGVITGPDQLHICMCYSPIRYAWDLQFQYLKEAKLNKGIKSWLVRWVLHRIRIWDSRTSNSVDEFIAISEFISRRIFKVYRRTSKIIYPPVDVSSFTLTNTKEDFYLTVSRMVSYKKIPMIVEAFSKMPDKTLIVIGDGPEFKKCQAVANTNVKLLGYQDNDVLRDYMQKAKAFIFAAEEDFGITPLEAQACGTPVIAYGKGGALETVIGTGDSSDNEDSTGLFFYEQNIESLIAAVNSFEKNKNLISPLSCRKNAERFSTVRFTSEFTCFINEKIKEHNVC